MSARIIFLPATAAFLLGCQTVDQPASTPSPYLDHKPHFQKADANRDGKLNRHEIAMHHHREELQKYDLDRDNRISQAEWESAHPSLADRDEHFNKVDKNSDGHISDNEALLFITEHVSFSDPFIKHDLDGDSQLHWKEIDEGAPAELRVTLFSIHPRA